ncbi:MAG: lamin tail domain-containing protein [Labilithrix sp.]|nr:lamin tail domain-containing protein [Labilithrix sp.]
MELSPLATWRAGLLLFTGAAFLFACAAETGATGKKKRTPMEPGDDFYDDETGQEQQPIEPTTNPDSGAFGAGARPAANKDGGRVDAGPDEGGTLPKVYCPGPLVAGDLAIVELMIASRAGSADDGEWVEIRSTRDCWLNLKGLVIESPRGALPANSVTVTEDFELAPKGMFIVADTADPVKNNGAARDGKLFAWNATDVLKNDGDSVILKMGATTVDNLTYPAFSNLEPGRTLAFPDDCAWNVRADWQRWSLTFDEWRPGKKGTPNATNDDVACY